ncbi:hypothetical protein HF519_29065, partial [Pseudonocardia bannensis]
MPSILQERPPPTAAPITDGRRSATEQVLVVVFMAVPLLALAAADLLGADAVAVLPSWETLPHERLSPRPDTVGRRLTIFRR